MNINTQYHPTARVKIRRTEILDGGSMDEEVFHYTYRVFEKGPGSNKRTTWLYKSDITLQQAIADYCDFKPLLDAYPTIRHEAHEVSDQFERICLLHHYLNVLKIPPTKVEHAIKKGNIVFCTV